MCREQNKLFKRLAAVSEGNIGAALHIWLGNIKSIEENRLELGTVDFAEIPPVLLPEWEVMLLQILLHKQLTERKLYRIYDTTDEQKTKVVLQSLLRTNLLVETAGKVIKINPYVLPYLVKYFRRNELI